jgi:hypothetical protein
VLDTISMASGRYREALLGSLAFTTLAVALIATDFRRAYVVVRVLYMVLGLLSLRVVVDAVSRLF